MCRDYDYEGHESNFLNNIKPIVIGGLQETLRGLLGEWLECHRSTKGYSFDWKQIFNRCGAWQASGYYMTMICNELYLHVRYTTFVCDIYVESYVCMCDIFVVSYVSMRDICFNVWYLGSELCLYVRYQWMELCLCMIFMFWAIFERVLSM